VDRPEQAEQAGTPEPTEFRLARGGDGRVREVKVRSTEIGGRKRRLFLDHLAATSNATQAARVAGANIRSFQYLRERDPGFAASWDDALDQAGPRLNGKLVVYAETRGKTEARPGEEEDELAGFDPQLALQILSLHRKRRGDRPERRGPKPRVATREEVDAAVLKALKKIARRLAQEGK